METLGYATDAAGASNEQFDKTLDSLESKLNALSNAWTEFTTGIANQTIIKGAVDILTALVNGVNNLTGVFGNIGGSVAKIALLWNTLRYGGSVLGMLVNSLTGANLNVRTLGQTFNSSLIPSIIRATTLTNVQRTTMIQLGWTTDFLNIKTNKQAAAEALRTIAQNASTTSANALTKAMLKLTAATGLTGGHILAIILIITAAVKVFNYFYISAKEAADGLKEYKESLNESAEAVEAAKQKMEEIQDITDNGYIGYDSKGVVKETKSIQELADGVDDLGNNISLTEEEYKGYQEILERLVAIGFAESVEDANSALKDTDGIDAAIEALEEYNKKLERTIKLESARNRSNWDEDEEAQKGWENDKEKAEKAAGYLKDKNKSGYDADGKKIQLEASNYELSLLELQQTAPSLDWKDGIFDENGNLVSKGVISNSGSIVINADNLQTWETKANELSQDKDEDAQLLSDKIFRMIEEFKGKLDDANIEMEGIVDDFYDSSFDIISGQTQDWQLDLEKKGFDGEELIEALMGDPTEWASSGLTTEEIRSRVQSLYNIFKDIDTFELADGTKLEDIKRENYTTDAEYLEARKQWVVDYWNGLSDEIKEKLKLDTLFGEADSGDNDQTTMENFGAALGVDFSAQPTSTEGQVGLSKDAQIVYDDLNATIGDQIQQAEVADRNIRILSNDYVELAEKVDNVNEVFDDNEDILDDANRGSIKYGRALDDVADAIEEAYGVDVTRDWVDANKDLVDGMDESEEGLNKFVEALISSDTGLMNTLNNVEDFKNGLYSVSDLINELGNQGALDLNATINGDNGPFLQALAQALRAGTITADEFDAIMKAMNYEAEFGYTMVWDTGAQAYKKVVSSVTYKRVSGAGLSGYTGGSSSGSGSSDKENDATFGQDPFYNYIKTVDQYTHALESLERELEILGDSDAVTENLSAQEEEYKRVIGANQSYLNEVNRQLEYMQEEGMSKWGDYLGFAEDGSLRLNEAYFDLTGDTVEELDDWIDAYDDILGRQTDLNEELDDYKKELKDLWEGWRDDYIDILEQLADILEEEDKKALEEKEDFYDKLEEQSQDYLEAVRKNIEAERDARDKANNYEELSKKQKRLSLLQRDTSGRYSSEVQSLQEEIANAQQELADQQVDDMLSQLEDQLDADERRHSETIDMMQKQIDEYVETRKYIEDAEAIIAQGDEAILAKLMEGEDYLEASDAERQQMIDEWGPQIGSLNKYVEYLGQGITTATQYIAKMMADGLTQATAAVVQAVGSISPTVVVNIGGSGGSGDGDGYSDSRKGNGCQACMMTCSGDCRNNNLNIATACQKNCSGSCTKASEGIARYKYATGGLVDYTGPAWVDGTKSKPEAFLNANQTSLIGSFAKSLERLSGSTTNSMLQGIGDCTIDISIGSIGKDYDIDQAIAKVKDEIVRSTEYRNVNILKRSR